MRFCAQLHIRDGLECSILWRNGIVSFSSEQIMRIWLPYLWGTLLRGSGWKGSWRPMRQERGQRAGNVTASARRSSKRDYTASIAYRSRLSFGQFMQRQFAHALKLREN